MNRYITTLVQCSRYVSAQLLSLNRLCETDSQLRLFCDLRSPARPDLAVLWINHDLTSNATL